MKAAVPIPRLGWSLRRLMALLLLVALPLLGFEFLAIFQLHQAREAEIRQDADRLLQLVESEQRRIADDIRHVLVALSETGVGRMEQAVCRDTLKRIREKYPRYLTIGITDRNHTVWCATNDQVVGLSAADRPYLQEAFRTGELAVGTYIVSRFTQRLAVPFSLAYQGADGSRAGVLTVLLDVGWLETYLAEKPLPEGASILIADKEGTILARFPEIPDLSGQRLPDRFLTLLHQGARGIVEWPGLDGVTRLTAYSPVGIGATDLYMHVGIDKATAMRAFDLAALRSLLIFIGLLAIVCIGAAWGMQRFVRARDEAQQSTLRAAMVLASTADGVIELDRNWCFAYLNDRARSLLGMGRDLVGRNLWQALPEMAHGPVADKLRQAMADQLPVEIEFRGLRTGHWYWARAFPSPDRLSVYLLDISERRRAEEELRESKERLNLALSSARAGAFDWDLRTGRGHWSDDSYRIFGLDPGKAPASNETWLQIVHPDDLEPATRSAREQIAGGIPDYRVEYRVLHSDGSERWILSTGRVRYDAEGRPSHCSGINIDITERKTMEEALRRSDERLNIALAAAEAGLWDFDARTRKLIWSEGMFRLFGRSPDSFTPSEDAFYELLHEDDREAVCRLIQDVFEGRRADFRTEFRVDHPQDGPRWILAVGRAAHDGNGRTVRLSGLNIDITARKEMENVLQQAKAQADEASLSKSKFLAAASHDLRQPLQSALLYAGVLHGHLRDEKAREPLLALERGLDTLKNLLDSLLDVSRLDAGVIVPQVADVPLGPLLSELAGAYAPIAASKGLDFRVELPPGVTAVRSDLLLLGRMLRNLVENAIRYTERGHVRIICEPTAEGVRVRVEDSGIGIPAEHMSRIFEEFHQVGNRERDRAQGLGLGLAIVQRLSRLLDHPVSVRSEHGKGAVFSIDLRRAAVAEPSGLPEPPEPVVEVNGRGRLALLVDDDVIVLTGLRSTFQSWGYEAVIAGSTEQAIESLQTLRRVPDLIVADYRLRDDQLGTEVVRRIREEVGEAVPGIILTGEIGSECEDNAASYGLSVVHKPITPRQLHSAVQELLKAVA